MNKLAISRVVAVANVIMKPQISSFIFPSQ